MDERLLSQLKIAQGRYVSGEELAQQLGVLPEAIVQRLDVLRAHGYEIEAQPHLGYKLLRVPDRLIDVELLDGLQTRTFGRHLQCFEETDSTMDAAHRWASAGAPEGAVVLAESQRAGRGRLGRTWASPPRQGIYGSLILRPALPMEALSTITLTMAVGLAQAIEQETGLAIQIKWPNDLMLNDVKLGGILTELQAEPDRVQYVVVGFGVNVNSDFTQLPPGSVSLQCALGHALPRPPLIRRMLASLEQAYAALVQQGFGALRQEWRMRSAILGHRIKLTAQAREIEGQALDIDESGALVVRHDTGLQERFTAGDVVKLW